MRVLLARVSISSVLRASRSSAAAGAPASRPVGRALTSRRTGAAAASSEASAQEMPGNVGSRHRRTCARCESMRRQRRPIGSNSRRRQLLRCSRRRARVAENSVTTRRRDKHRPTGAGGPSGEPRERHQQSKFSGRSSWTPFTTRRVPRRQVFRFFWFRSLPADFRSTPLILTLGSRC